MYPHDQRSRPAPGPNSRPNSRPNRRPNPGRNRRRRARRNPWRRVWLAGAGTGAALLAATGLAVGTSQGFDLAAVFGEPTAAPSHGDATAPVPDPTPSATPAPRRAKVKKKGPIVNGRRQPLRVAVPNSAGGRYAVVPGTARPPRTSRGKVVRYLVEVERGLPFRGPEFAAAVHRTLNNARSWGHGGRMRFLRVARGPVQIRVSLSSPALTSSRCLPLRVGYELSCWQRGRAVINARRWGQGATTYGRDLASYREYVINHEVGHGLGHGHAGCPAPGRPAPVMVQQTKSLGGCRPNPWPTPPRTR